MPVITDISGFIAAFKACVADGTFVRATLGKATSELFPAKVFITPVTVQGLPRLQIVERFPTRDTTKHWDPEEVVGKVGAWLGKRFLSATIFTTAADFSVDHNRRLEPRFTSGRPTEGGIFKPGKTFPLAKGGEGGLNAAAGGSTEPIANPLNPLVRGKWEKRGSTHPGPGSKIWGF